MAKNLIDLGKQWVAKAESDLLTAENNLNAEHQALDMVCFHFHQAVEKLLKAYLVINDISLNKTHDLLFLLEKINLITNALEKYRDEIASLNPYAVEIRYPDDFFMPTIADAEDAKKITYEIKEWLKNTVPELFEK